MSIFSKIKNSKKVASEHKAAVAAAAAAQAAKPAPAPYRHIPTHAAQDALASTPGAADRQAIREANHQRSMNHEQSWYWSSSSPSLVRNQSSAATSLKTDGPSTPASNKPPLLDRRSHPGYQSYQQSFQHIALTEASRKSPVAHGKSPTGSGPVNPFDSKTASTSSSMTSISGRSYNDRIQHSAPFSQRLEAIPSSPPKTSHHHVAPQVKPRSWGVVAASRVADAGMTMI